MWNSLDERPYEEYPLCSYAQIRGAKGLRVLLADPFLSVSRFLRFKHPGGRDAYGYNS